MKTIEVVESTVKALPGTQTIACIKESISLAIDRNEIIVLYHNDKEYIIDPKEIVDKIYNKGIMK